MAADGGRGLNYDGTDEEHQKGRKVDEMNETFCDVHAFSLLDADADNTRSI